MDYVTRQILSAYSYFTGMAEVFIFYAKINVKAFQSFSTSIWAVPTLFLLSYNKVSSKVLSF